VLNFVLCVDFMRRFGNGLQFC